MLEDTPPGRVVEPGFGLSPREAEVLELLSLGLTNLQIAGRLRVTVHAVKFHLAAIYRKLGVANRTEATAVYLRRNAAGWVAES
jgi:DNA-binding CsgD family transcriptional regulator